jgi:sigma-E factor negative regulatory protein RseC
MANIQIDKDCDLEAIKHSGVIKDIDNHQYYVSIVAQSACVSCSVKGVCNVSEMKDEIVEVPRNKSENFAVGDKVEVLMEKSQGTKAVMLGYIMPFLIVVVTLIVSLNLIKNEGLSGLISVGILVPYYFILYVNRERLKTTFRFRIR